MNQIKIPERMRQETRRHMQPAPETAVSQPSPFSRKLWLGLWAGVMIGAVTGLLFGRLLFTGVINPGGWEAIFSSDPFTFHFFWAVLGLSLGLILSGVSTILTTKAPE